MRHLKYTEEQNRLFKACFDLEKEIMDLWSNSRSYCPLNNDDWTDAHQEYLEAQWAKEELDALYQEAQKKLFAALEQPSRKVKTASEYYRKQKDLEETVKYYKKHHINGF